MSQRVLVTPKLQSHSKLHSKLQPHSSCNRAYYPKTHFSTEHNSGLSTDLHLVGGSAQDSFARAVEENYKWRQKGDEHTKKVCALTVLISEDCAVVFEINCVRYPHHWE
jgi:hypothetical protein